MSLLAHRKQMSTPGRMLIAAVVIAVAGLFYAWWIAGHSEKHIHNELLFRAQTLSEAVKLDRIRAIEKEDSHADSAIYARLKRQLDLASGACNICEEIFLLGQRGNGDTFLIITNSQDDGEHESDDVPYSIEPMAKQVFETGIPTVLHNWDEAKGLHLSLVPLKEPNTKATPAIVGIVSNKNGIPHGQRSSVLFPLLLMFITLCVLAAGTAFLSRSPLVKQASVYRQTVYGNSFALIIAGLFLSTVTACIVNELELDKRDTAFRHLAHDKTGDIARSLNSVDDIELEALARFFESSEFVSPEEFKDYTKYLLRNPVVKSWHWIEPVDVLLKTDAEARARAQGMADFEIRPPAWSKANLENTTSMHYSVFRVAPLAGNENVLGVDLGADTVFREAIEKAIKTGLSSCTTPYIPSKGFDDSPHIMIFHPSYQKGSGQLMGFAGGEVNLDNLVLSVNPARMLSIKIENAETQSGRDPSENGAAERASSDGLSMIRPAFAYGKTFHIKAYAGSGLLEMHPLFSGWLVAIVGIMFTATLTVLSVAVFRRRSELEGMVVEATNQAELAMAGARLGVWDWNVKAKTLTINDNCARMLGLAPDNLEYSQEKWRELIHTDDLEMINSSVQAHLAGETEFIESEHRMMNREGNYIWVLTRGRAIEKDNEGRPTRICGTYLDKTERRTVEDELNKNRTHLRTLVDTLPDLVWLKDPHGVYIACNRKFERFFGAMESEIIGKTDFDFVDRELAELFRANDAAAINAGGPRLNEEEITYADDGHRELLETIKTPMFDSEGTLIGVLGISRDITDRRRAEEEKEKLSNQLLHSQKMQAIGILAGGVAHDFNNMLGVILGNAQLLKEIAPDEVSGSEEIHEIILAAKRSRDLTSKLLLFARKDARRELEVISPNELIASVESMLKRSAPPNIKIQNLVMADYFIECDVNQINQSLLNICINAIDAMEDGGELKIECEKNEFDVNECPECRKEIRSPFCCIRITDTGVGIPKELLEKVTEPFFTTKKIGKGTGLGLSVTHGIIKGHNGHLHISSKEGKGTTVQIFMPICTTPHASNQDEAEQHAPTTGKERIMVIDDEAPMMRMTSRLLQSAGYETVCFDTGEEAIGYYAQEHENCALVVLDMMMPEMDGPEVYAQLLRISPETRVLFISGQRVNRETEQVIENASHRFLQKPFMKEELLENVREILDAGTG